MKHLTLAVIGVSLLVAVILGAGGVAAADLQDAVGLYPHSVQIIGGQINVRSASTGRISATSTYQTNTVIRGFGA